MEELINIPIEMSERRGSLKEQPSNMLGMQGEGQQVRKKKRKVVNRREC